MITRVINDSPQRDLGWCIVVAEGPSPKWASSAEAAGYPLPIQYCCIDEPVTLLQKALHRATNISRAARILVTVEERNREKLRSAPLADLRVPMTKCPQGGLFNVRRNT
jgi:hypothetical protein